MPTNPSDKNLYGVILAGGSGTRFWPLSRQEEPKQFLKILNGRSLLQETIARIKPLIPSERVWVVTNKLYAKKIQQQLSVFKIPSKNILLEPEGKNTAPAICWAGRLIHNQNPRAVMAVLPSDHLITDAIAFLKCLNDAVSLAQKDYLVTLGIVPTRPETGYGYLQTKKINAGSQAAIHMVKRFVEKPSLAVAERFLKSKKYLWNSGIFIWKTETILKGFEQFLPEIAMSFPKGKGVLSIPKIWRKLPSISIDYGILEKSDRVVTVPAEAIGWSDLGSWESLSEILSKDKSGNVLKGDIQCLDCDGTFVWGAKRLIAAIGLKDIVIVDTPDALLVCPKTQSQKIKNVVESLKQQQRVEWVR